MLNKRVDKCSAKQDASMIDKKSNSLVQYNSIWLVDTAWAVSTSRFFCNICYLLIKAGKLTNEDKEDNMSADLFGNKAMTAEFADDFLWRLGPGIKLLLPAPGAMGIMFRKDIDDRPDIKDIRQD